MTATEKVAEGLKMRGFFVEVVDGVLVFSKCNAEGDSEQVRHMLNHLTIPYVAHSADTIEILVNKLPNAVFRRMFEFSGAPFHVGLEKRHATWRFFTSQRFGVRVDTLDLEYNMARFVKTANLAGITTFSGCNGHLKHSPRFQFSGAFHGAWFAAVQKKYMTDLQLNYNWEVLYQGHTLAELRVTGTSKWHQNRIHQDTLKMAEVLEVYATEIRELKKSIFSKHQKATPKSFVCEGKFETLEAWMYDMAFDKSIEVVNFTAHTAI